jgi:hypothetical protein
MICLHCGYCCKWLSVVIVNDPSKGIREGNLIVHEGHGESCKHLCGEEPGKYSCAIHGKKWYKQTPCFSHSQIERKPDENCRMGVFVLKERKRDV